MQNEPGLQPGGFPVAPRRIPFSKRKESKSAAEVGRCKTSNGHIHTRCEAPKEKLTFTRGNCLFLKNGG